MKKFLLGTTALIAASAFAVAAAQADEMAEDEMMEPAGPVTVGIAGYTVGIIGINSTDMVEDKTGALHPARGEEVFHIYEFVLSGSTTLDNGITVGVHTQLGSSAQFGDRCHYPLTSSTSH